MSSGLMLALILVALFASIAIGYLTKKNIGYIAIAFAYILGVFVFKQSAGSILGLWPTGLFLTMVSIMAFYGYASANGTLQLLAEKVIYPFRKKVMLLPFVVFFVEIILASIAGNTAVTAFFPVLCFTIALTAGWDPVLFSTISCFASVLGGSLPWSQTGVLINGILEKAGMADMAGSYTLRNSIASIISFTIFIILVFIFTKGSKVKSIEMEQPKAFNPVQKKTLVVVAVVAVLVVVPSLFKILAPASGIGKMAGNFNLGLIAFTGAAVCALLNLGQEREIIRRIPWGTFIMICGVYILVSLATAVGATDKLSEMIGLGLPNWLIAPIFALAAGIMSMFSSFQVVIAIMLPMVPSIVGITGANPVLYIVAIFAGSISASISPFSNGGMMTMSQCYDEVERDKLFNKQFIMAICAVLFITVLSLIGVYRLF